MQYNVATAKIVVAAFFAFCCAGKLCIDSFLSVYLRHMGFSPFQAGVLRCLQFLMGGASIIVISYCTNFFQKRLSLAVFILVSIISYLLLVIASLQYPCFYTPRASCSERLSTRPSVAYSTPFLPTHPQSTMNPWSGFTFRPNDQYHSVHDQSVKTVPSFSTDEELINSGTIPEQHQTVFVNEKRTNIKLAKQTSAAAGTRKEIYKPVGDATLPASFVVSENKTTEKVHARNDFSGSTGNNYDFDTGTEGKFPSKDNAEFDTTIIEQVESEPALIEMTTPTYNEMNILLPTAAVVEYYEGLSSQKTVKPEKYFQKVELTHVPEVTKKEAWNKFNPNVLPESGIETRNGNINASYWYQRRYYFPKDKDGQLYNYRRGNRNPLFPYYNQHTHRAKKGDALRQKRSNFAAKINENENQTVYVVQKRDTPYSQTTDVPLGLQNSTSVKLFHKLWPSLNLACLFVILGLLIIGEFASSPIDKMADESWYQYLDEIDYIERYDQRTSGVLITSTLTLLGIVLVVKMYCKTELLVFPAYHLHFYVFALYWAIIFFLGYFFPQTTSSSIQSNGMFKGVTFVGHMCRSSSSAIVLITVILCGALHGCINDFVLWYMEDIGATEFITTSAVAIAVASEILPWMFSRYTYFFRRATMACMLCMSIFSYAARFGLIAGLPMPWAIAGTQALHCFSNYFFWVGVHNYVTRLSSHGTSRSVLVILNLIYYHLGRAFGSCFGGLVYSMSKPQMLFWCMAGISLLWGLLFFMLQYCSFSLGVPRGSLSKSAFRNYGDADDLQQSSLLGGEEEEDDWLEAAKKVDK